MRRLWRGEAVPFDGPGGTIDVVTQPRPVSRELPVWITTAGNPDSFREAGRLGANLLTHLLGQTVEELGEKIAIYRTALAEAGHDPAAHTVTLMLHTLLGEDREAVRALAREPMRDYLRSAAALVKQYAWAFPAFKRPAGVTQPMALDLRTLAPEEMDAILDFAFERYFENSGLFGTRADALARAAQVKAVGVDEIACLIDFGLPTATVLESLHPLAAVVADCNRGAAEATEEPDGLGALIRRHWVSHLQCTPSMARMLLGSPEDRAGLDGLRHLHVGGEAVSGDLVAELRAAGVATITNMYGPTETTIWSSTQEALPGAGTVPLGRPIANTRLYVLDGRMRPLPPLLPGELYIGGDGVARGYLNRPELTAERFLADPFAEGGRLYRTGDLVQFEPDGTLRFLGRIDGQVKLRGHRIELGEIETALRAESGVGEAVAIMREDRPGDQRLVAYIVPDGSAPPAETLRAALARTLPEIMVPAHVVTLERLPLTPNAKIDRKALPPPSRRRPRWPRKRSRRPSRPTGWRRQSRQCSAACWGWSGWRARPASSRSAATRCWRCRRTASSRRAWRPGSGSPTCSASPRRGRSRATSPMRAPPTRPWPASPAAPPSAATRCAAGAGRCARLATRAEAPGGLGRKA
ncbi:hypothetical protein GCM10025880_32760 [Methylorubrum aminovorans]|nr:hypothetical protein GCM10025880_32760 [Methylorubrum aminovorans]